MRTVSSVGVAIVVLLAVGGCKSRQGSACEAPPVAQAAPCAPVAAPDRPVTNRVNPGDTLHGHLNPDQLCQCFYFEGVEYSLLDMELHTDVGNQAAPSLKIDDPEGKPLELQPQLGPEGSSCQRATGVVLHKTGTYRATVCRTGCDPEHFYSWKYALRLVPPPEQDLHLTPCTTKAISFIAARGTEVTVTLAPTSRNGVLPRVMGVKGPDGGRALAPEAQLEGAKVPTISEERENARMLRFNAARPGRYTVLVSADPNTQGDATATVCLKPAKACPRQLYHDGSPCPDGSCPRSGTQVAQR